MPNLAFHPEYLVALLLLVALAWCVRPGPQQRVRVFATAAVCVFVVATLCGMRRHFGWYAALLYLGGYLVGRTLNAYPRETRHTRAMHAANLPNTNRAPRRAEDGR